MAVYASLPAKLDALRAVQKEALDDGLFGVAQQLGRVLDTPVADVRPVDVTDAETWRLVCLLSALLGKYTDAEPRTPTVKHVLDQAEQWLEEH